ncbi:hypothetical protein [Rhodoferax bucti]|uniref:hypothetical protein n=1 Tax=Rhodoferax bucti TaxID=2576305 RepID=UPI001107CA23|nr:hypothetical protein [Rhodoferax bucti]
MSYNRLLSVVFLAVCTLQLAACSAPSAKTTLHETRTIKPDDGVSIFWDIGIFSGSPEIHNALNQNGTYSQRFEACTNDFLVKTFQRNGYVATAERRPLATVNNTASNAKFILILNNAKARYTSGSVIAHTIGLTLEGTLYERDTGKSLLSVTYPLSSMADDNGALVVQLVRGLAKKGFLDRPVEKVVDYDGVLTQSFRKTSDCPISVSAQR